MRKSPLGAPIRLSRLICSRRLQPGAEAGDVAHRRVAITGPLRDREAGALPGEETNQVGGSQQVGAIHAPQGVPRRRAGWVGRRPNAAGQAARRRAPPRRPEAPAGRQGETAGVSPPARRYCGPAACGRPCGKLGGATVTTCPARGAPGGRAAGPASATAALSGLSSLRSN